MTGGSLENCDGNAVFSRVVGDSRKAGPETLFVALKGANSDGHDYVVDALDAGSPAALVDRNPIGAAAVVVNETVEALTKLAAYVRDYTDPLVIGITGSVGKTSTKDFLAAVSRRKFETVAPERSFNNEIGVPITLLRLEMTTEVLICEMGARGPGQIAEICEYVRPQVGVVTNVDVAHLEKFGSQDSIARSKSELIQSLPEGGTAVLNADDELVMAMAEVTKADVMTFGLSSKATTTATDVEMSAGRASFRLVNGNERTPVQLKVVGRHQVENALAAACAGLALGLTLEECAAGIGEATATPWRMETSVVHGVTLINDAWNSNPRALTAALDAAEDIKRAGKGAGRVIAVLGYMAELGEIERAEHLRMGRVAAHVCDRLVVVGERATGLLRGAEEEGLRDVRYSEDTQDALQHLKDLRRGDVVLVKGSRAAGMEGMTEKIAALVDEPA